MVGALIHWASGFRRMVLFDCQSSLAGVDTGPGVGYSGIPKDCLSCCR